MRFELIHALKTLTDEEKIKKMILEMDAKSIAYLLALLDIADSETRERWLQIYTKLLKY